MKKYCQIILGLVICFFSIFGISDLIYNVEKEKNYYYELSAAELMKKKDDDNLIVYYFKKDCMPCSLFKQTLNKQIKLYKYKVYAINIMDTSNNGEFLDNSNIKYTPTLIKFENGKETKRLEGNVGESKLNAFLNT